MIASRYAEARPIAPSAQKAWLAPEQVYSADHFATRVNQSPLQLIATHT